MTVLDLLVVFLAVFILWRYLVSKVSFREWLFGKSLGTYLCKAFIILFILSYTIKFAISRVNWQFLNYKIL